MGGARSCSTGLVSASPRRRLQVVQTYQDISDAYVRHMSSTDQQAPTGDGPSSGGDTAQVPQA